MDFSFEINLKTREIFSQILKSHTLNQLNKIPKGYSNNIFWNIKHIVITQQLLIYGLSQLPLNISEVEVNSYKRGTRPNRDINDKDLVLLKKQLFSTLKQTKEDFKKHLFKDYTEYTVTTKTTLTNVEDAIEFNNFHEGIHLGYVLALKRLI